MGPAERGSGEGRKKKSKFKRMPMRAFRQVSGRRRFEKERGAKKIIGPPPQKKKKKKKRKKRASIFERG